MSEVTFLACDACGSDIVGSHPTPGWYSDGEAIVCGDCGATNHVSCDDESDPYVSSYDCKHGLHDTQACDRCEIEFGGGVGEVAS